MSTIARTNLKTYRQSLANKIAQEDLARLADLRLSTYRNAEQGKNVSYTTATKILRAINNLREKQDMEAVRLEDLGLSIV